MNESTSPAPSGALAASDEQVMWRVQMLDDPQAFAGLMTRWEPPIRNLCARMLGDRHRAQDLTQEAFVRVFSRRKDYRPTGRFSTFLWRIALNLCHDELRRDKRRREVPLAVLAEDEEVSDPPVAAVEGGPDAETDSRERAELVRQALLRLPESHRTVVVLRHYEGLKFREIADVLEIPEGTVKSRMAESLTQLGRWLKRSLHDEAARPGCASTAAPTISPNQPRL